MKNIMGAYLSLGEGEALSCALVIMCNHLVTLLIIMSSKIAPSMKTHVNMGPGGHCRRGKGLISCPQQIDLCLFVVLSSKAQSVTDCQHRPNVSV